MNREIRVSISAIAAAVMLAACASKGPANQTGVAAAEDGTSAEVQRLIDNASDQRICKRQAVTGSRIDSQVCLTRAEMEEQRLEADRVLREIRSSAATRQPMPDRPQMPTSTPRTP